MSREQQVSKAYRSVPTVREEIKMKQTYEIIFKCVITLEARDKEEAVRLAWLRDSLDMKSTYKFLAVQVKKE